MLYNVNFIIPVNISYYDGNEKNNYTLVEFSMNRNLKTIPSDIEYPKTIITFDNGDNIGLDNIKKRFDISYGNYIYDCYLNPIYFGQLLENIDIMIQRGFDCLKYNNYYFELSDGDYDKNDLFDFLNDAIEQIPSEFLNKITIDRSIIGENENISGLDTSKHGFKVYGF